ncbi:MAG: ferrochelatase [Polyangiaceae bacterium]|nr:ferrochelatase [Polyangiaceae bacterium]
MARPAHASLCGARDPGSDRVTGPADAVVLAYHGTVERSDDLPAFLRNIRRGAEPPPALVAEVRARYERVGGSPLRRTSEAVARALEERLGVPVRAAGRLWHPYLGDVARELVLAGARRLVSLPLAPQSVHVYHAALGAELPAGVELVPVPPWGLEPALLDAFVASIEAALAALAVPARAALLLTAHSLPERVLAAGDPYERDFRSMAAAVGERVGTRVGRVEVAFQSQGLGGGAWLGPDLRTAFASLRASGVEELAVAPIGFLAEHVETLYDLDVEAAGLAREAGFVRYARARALDADGRLVDALEAVARRALAGSSHRQAGSST